jgi:hypothetical protein
MLAAPVETLHSLRYAFNRGACFGRQQASDTRAAPFVCCSGGRGQGTLHGWQQPSTTCQPEVYKRGRYVVRRSFKPTSQIDGCQDGCQNRSNLSDTIASGSLP